MTSVNLLPLEMLVSILQQLWHPIRLRYAVVSSTWKNAVDMTVLTDKDRDIYRKVAAKHTRTFNGLTCAIRLWHRIANTDGRYHTPPTWPIGSCKSGYREHRIQYEQYQKYLKEYKRDPTFIEKLEANAELLRAKCYAQGSRARVTGLTSHWINKRVNDSS